MIATRLWIGLVFVTLGIFGLLEVAGAVDWGDTIEKWWPIAIIGFGIAGMITDRRVTIGGIVITSIGVVLLIDEQGWTGEDAVWAFLLLVIGVAILLGGSHPKEEPGAGPKEPIRPAPQ